MNFRSHGREPLTGPQIKAARAMLGMKAEDLADLASVGVATVRRAESSDGIPSITDANMLAIRRAMEDAGIVFLFEDGLGRGVRLRKASIRLRKYDNFGAIFDLVNSDGTIIECFISREAMDNLDGERKQRRPAALIFQDYDLVIERLARAVIRRMQSSGDSGRPSILAESASGSVRK